MAGGKTVTINIELPFDITAPVRKIATEYDISFTKALIKVIKTGLEYFGEETEVGINTPEGKRRKDGVPSRVNHMRKTL